MQSRLVVFLATIVVALGALPLPTSAQTQTRPRLEDFGSSLKVLKWNQERGVAVETKAPRRPRSASDEDVIKVDTNLVVCDVDVRDGAGRVIHGLTQNDFLVTEDGQPQHIEHFSLGNDQRVGRSIVLLIDYSSSQSPFIKSSVAAAKVLVDQLGPKETMAIVTDDVAMLIDFTRDKIRLKQALDSLVKKSESRQYGRSLQFSALMAAVRELFTEGDIRPIVIFQTEGDELFNLRPSSPPILSIPALYSPPENSEAANFSLRDVYRAIEKSRASVYTVIPGRRVIGPANDPDLEWSISPASTASSRVPVTFLEKLSWFQLSAAGAAIGGWTSYLQTPKEAPEIYGSILADINSRYVIGYYPTNKTHDGSRRKVTVVVREHPEYSVSGRRSYIAPEPD